MSIDKITPEEWNEARNLLASERQVGGNHYKNKGIQPLEYAYANGLTPNITNVVKYVTRKKGSEKDQIKDLLKAIHYIELELEMVFKVNPKGKPINNIDCEKVDWEIFLNKQYLFYYQQNAGEIILNQDEWYKENKKSLIEEYKNERII